MPLYVKGRQWCVFKYRKKWKSVKENTSVKNF